MPDEADMDFKTANLYFNYTKKYHEKQLLSDNYTDHATIGIINNFLHGILKL